MIKNINTTLFEQGKIKIGAKGKKKKSARGTEYNEPVKLDHFNITTLERDGTPEQNFKVDEKAMEGLPENPTSLPIEFLYDDIELNFPAGYAMFRKDGLFCKGDGETATREGKEISCNPDTCKFYQSKSCKVGGILLCRFPHLKNLMGVYKFRTHSWNSVKNILASLQFIQTLTGGVVAGLPFEMRLERKPSKHGIVKVVNVVFPGDQDDLADALEQEVARRKRLNFDIQKIEKSAILAGVTQDTDDPEDVAAEFYPKQVSGVAESQEDIDKEIEQLHANIMKLWDKYDINDFERSASMDKHFHTKALKDCRDRERLREYGRTHQEQYKTAAAKKKAKEEGQLTLVKEKSTIEQEEAVAGFNAVVQAFGKGSEESLAYTAARTINDDEAVLKLIMLAQEKNNVVSSMPEKINPNEIPNGGLPYE